MIAIPTKAYVAGGIIVVILITGWYVIGMFKENGELTQANATLNKAVKDGEKKYNDMKLIADANSAAVDKAGKEKSKLNTYALKIAHELEILKNENADIKKWSITYVPVVLVDRLLGFSGDDNKDGLYKPAEGVVNVHRRAPNENLYNYAINLRSALRSCNADKAALREWYQDIGIVLQ